MTSKHQNPREGIKTTLQNVCVRAICDYLQNTKIPVRGLKRNSYSIAWRLDEIPSKHQNPREGIKTHNPYRGTAVDPLPLASKHQNPREGIKTHNIHVPPRIFPPSLQNTKIPVRGLKRTHQYTCRRHRDVYLQNTKIPVRGLKLRYASSTVATMTLLQNTKIPVRGLKQHATAYIASALLHAFKTPKSP